MLSVNRIRKSSSLYNSLIIFMEKKDKNNPLRLIINYCRLNNIIILIHYPIPFINKLQNRLAGAKYFIKIHLKLGFYFIRMAEKEK